MDFENEDLECIYGVLKDVNYTIELGLNGAMLRDGYGGIEGLTVAIKETGAEITEAIIT